MYDVLLLEKLERWENLFDFTVRGIEGHLEECEPDKDQIINALILLSESLFNITSEANERAKKARAAR